MTDSTPSTACFGCGAEAPGVDGPTHAYILSSPGCWQLFGQVLAAEFSDPARWPVHQLTVDTYAVQHPSRDRRGRQSVARHLMGLCLQLEHDLPPEQVPARRATQLERRRSTGFPELAPHPTSYALTVADVAGISDPSEHRARVRDWAESASRSWSVHHEHVRGWVLADFRAAHRRP